MTRVYGPDSGGRADSPVQEVTLHTPKMQRCVQHVQAKGKVDNAYAVCTSSIGYAGAILPEHQRRNKKG